MSAKIICKSYNQNDSLLFPPSLGELIPENHPVRTVSVIIDKLDISGIESVANKYTFVWKGSVEKNKARLEAKVDAVLKRAEAAHRKGRCVDVNNALDGEGPFSSERAGTLPAGDLIDLCFSGKWSQSELKKRISGRAGLAAHLGTTDVQAVVKRIEEGDEHARLVLDAMIYQIAKSVGAAAVVLYGQVDAILLTGGIAHSDYIISRLRERISFLAPVRVYPGEDELEALALNALGALRGELTVQVYR